MLFAISIVSWLPLVILNLWDREPEEMQPLYAESLYFIKGKAQTQMHEDAFSDFSAALIKLCALARVLHFVPSYEKC